MITRSGAGPKQGGGYPTFYWAWGGVIWFLFWFEGGSDNFILLYFTSFNAFFVCLPCVKKPYIIHRFILSPYGPTIYYNGMFLFCAHFTRHGTNWWWTCLWPDVTPFHRGGSARGIACRTSGLSSTLTCQRTSCHINLFKAPDGLNTDNECWSFFHEHVSFQEREWVLLPRFNKSNTPLLPGPMTSSQQL